MIPAIVTESDETFMTLYHPDDTLLLLVKTIVGCEGLFVWQPLLIAAEGRNITATMDRLDYEMLLKEQAPPLCRSKFNEHRAAFSTSHPHKNPV